MMKMRDFARLVRLPNTFTAMADILLGAIVTHSLPRAHRHRLVAPDGFRRPLLGRHGVE